MNTLPEVLDQVGHPRVLVIGDLILDRYTFGNAERVSPEAPVIVLRVDSKEVRLGGAASVAMLLRALEADVALAGVVGDDPEGRALLSLLHDDKIDCQLVCVDPSRPTTSKERVVGRAANRHSHQIVRIDHEARDTINETLEHDLMQTILARLSGFQSLLVADYAKGVCTPTILRTVITAAHELGIPVIVDPARIADYSRYSGATLLKPNRTEAELASDRPIGSPAEALHVGEQFCRAHHLGATVITLDRDGMALVQSNGSTELFPSYTREVYDITGAGDMVMAALGLCLASATPIAAAVRIANLAGGLQVQRFGVAPVTRFELLQAMGRSFGPPSTEHLPVAGADVDMASRPTSSKVTTVDALLPLVDEYRRLGKSVVFTNGCFDLLHVGHVTYLQEGAALGDILIVAVNSDTSVRALKGSGRPVIPEHDRAVMLASLGCVDHVLVFEDPTPHKLLEAIRPDVLAKGGTTAQIVGKEVVESYGGRAIRLSEVHGISTTALLTTLPAFSRDSQPSGTSPTSEESNSRATSKSNPESEIPNDPASQLASGPTPCLHPF